MIRLASLFAQIALLLTQALNEAARPIKYKFDYCIFAKSEQALTISRDPVFIQIKKTTRGSLAISYVGNEDFPRSSPQTFAGSNVCSADQLYICQAGSYNCSIR
jgi:hypothetical protein